MFRLSLAFFVFLFFSRALHAQPVSILDQNPLLAPRFSTSQNVRTRLVRAKHAHFDSALRVTLEKTPADGVLHVDFRFQRAVAEGNFIAFRFFVRSPKGRGSAQLSVGAAPGWESPIGSPRREVGATWTHFALHFQAPQSREAGQMWLRFSLSSPQTVEIAGLSALDFGMSSNAVVARWASWPASLQNPARSLAFQPPKTPPAPLPDWTQWHQSAPRPLLGARRDWERLFRRAWDEPFDRLRQPPSGSPLVSPFLDISGNGTLVQWDTIFAAFCLRYGQSTFAPLSSLDNFYALQHKGGFIHPEITAEGLEMAFHGPVNAANPPIFAWAEWEYFRFSGDKTRLARVFPVLEKHLAWFNREGDAAKINGSQRPLEHGRRAKNSRHRLFWNTGIGSGTSDLPREGTGWVDASSQMVLAWDCLANIAEELGKRRDAARFRRSAQELSAQINRWCWNENDGFYYDVRADGSQFKTQSVAGFWPLLAGVADQKQAARLATHLLDERKFWRAVPFPSLSAQHPKYDPKRNVWLGATWPPTNYMIIKGLERYGFEELATTATNKYLNALAAVLNEKNGFGDIYSSEAPFQRLSGPSPWASLGPVALLVENALGFRVKGAKNTLEWRLSRTDFHGIENLRVGQTTVAAFCAPRKHARDAAKLEIFTDAPLKLVVWNGKTRAEWDLEAGRSELNVESSG